MAIPADLPDARHPRLAAKRVAFGVVRGQAAITLVAALAGWLLGGGHVGMSAAFGGAIGTVASLAMALMAFRGGSAPATSPAAAADGAARTDGLVAGMEPGSAARILGMFYAGEMVKVAIAIVSFIVVLKLTGASPLPMFGAYMATFVVYWIVLARMALPVLSATRRARA